MELTPNYGNISQGKSRIPDEAALISGTDSSADFAASLTFMQEAPDTVLSCLHKREFEPVLSWVEKPGTTPCRCKTEFQQSALP